MGTNKDIGITVMPVLPAIPGAKYNRNGLDISGIPPSVKTQEELMQDIPQMDSNGNIIESDNTLTETNFFTDGYNKLKNTVTDATSELVFNSLIWVILGLIILVGAYGLIVPNPTGTAVNLANTAGKAAVKAAVA